MCALPPAPVKMETAEVKDSDQRRSGSHRFPLGWSLYDRTRAATIPMSSECGFGGSIPREGAPSMPR
jgi:hypothetical protein